MLTLLLACTTADTGLPKDDSESVDTPADECGVGTVYLYGSFTLDGATLTGEYGAIGVYDGDDPLDPTEHACDAVGPITSAPYSGGGCTNCTEAWVVQNDDPAPAGDACAFIAEATWPYASAQWALSWYEPSSLGSDIIDFHDGNKWSGFAGNLANPADWPTAVSVREDGLDFYTAVQESETTLSGDARVFEVPCE